MMKLLVCLLLLFTSLPAFAGQVQQISQQEMEQVLGDFLADQSQLLHNVELRFASLSLPAAFEVPQGRIEHQVIPANPALIGSRRMTLLTRVDGQTVSNLSIRVELEALAEVVVTAGNLKRGDLLGAENLSLQRLDISRLKDPIFELSEVSGKLLRRSLRLGQPLQRNQVEFPPLVKRGELVTIQARRNGLLLTAAGEARQDGQEGDSIRVMNSNSRREVLCRVVAPGLVSVEF